MFLAKIQTGHFRNFAIVRKSKSILGSLCQNQNYSSDLSSFKSKWVKTNVDQCPGVLTSTVNIEPTFGVSIPEFLQTNLHKFEDAPAFECAVTGRKYTHREIHRKSKSFAAALKQHGLKKREAVCILLPNIPEYPIVALGVWNAGLVVSPINPAYTIEEVAKQVNDCQGKTIVTIPKLVPLVEKMKELSPSLKSIIVVGDTGGKNHSFCEMIKTDPSGIKLLQGKDINSTRETAVLPYSSGTTGVPKGCELTHSTFTTNLQQITYPGYRFTQFYETGQSKYQERLVAALPFFHMYGLQIIMALTLYQGSHTLCFPLFEPSLFIKGLKSHRPTVLHLVTPLISFMCQTDKLTKEDLKDTRGCIAGAAPVGKTLIERFVGSFDHDFFFQEGYGMTEISSVSHLIPPETKNTKAGSSGVLVPGTSAKVVDPESGSVVGPNETGEICVRGPQIMKGYFNNEQATIDTIDHEGYLKTGDIGYHDEQGFLYIVDRLKELIKVKGLQVAPAELENILRQHSDVADVAVIGIPHDRYGEVPRAYIVPKSKTPDESSVKKFVESKTAEHKHLLGGVEFIEVIPKAPSGKILRRVLKNKYLATQ